MILTPNKAQLPVLKAKGFQWASGVTWGHVDREQEAENAAFCFTLVPIVGALHEEMHASHL